MSKLKELLKSARKFDQAKDVLGTDKGLRVLSHPMEMPKKMYDPVNEKMLGDHINTEIDVAEQLIDSYQYPKKIKAEKLEEAYDDISKKAYMVEHNDDAALAMQQHAKSLHDLRDTFLSGGSAKQVSEAQSDMEKYRRILELMKKVQD